MPTKPRKSAPRAAHSPETSPAAGESGISAEAMAVLLRLSRHVPVALDANGWPVDGEGRRIYLESSKAPTAEHFGRAECVEYSRLVGVMPGYAIERAASALDAMEGLADLLLSHELEKDFEEPSFVLSDLQRVRLLKASHVLASLARGELLMSMESARKRAEGGQS